MLETLTRDYSSIISNGTFWNIIFVLFIIFALYLSWLTTCISPLDYRIWVTQIFSYETYRLVQIHNLNRQNRRHIFWRSPFTTNSAPQVSTLVIVQRPAEVNFPYNRNIPFNFFTENENDTPDNEQQAQIVNFISETIEAERPEDNQDDTIVTTQNPPAETSNSWQALAEIVQQSSTNTNHQTSFTSNNQSNTMSTTCTTAPTPEEEEDVTIKLKHPDDSIKLVKAKLSTNVSTFKTQNFGEDASKTNLIFQGSNLADENRTLKFYGLFPECVVHYVTEGPADTNEEVTTIRLKYLDDRIVNAQFPPNATVSDFKKLHFAPELADGKVIRLIFQGQLLRNEGRTLASYGIVEQSVIHVHIGQSAYRQEGASPQPSTTHNINDPTELFANPHLVVTGIVWLDSALLTFLSTILFIVRWAEADDVLEENDHSFTARMHRWLRLIIRCLTSMIAFMIIPQENDIDMQHNFGMFFNFFVVIKIIFLIGIALFFPQVVELKTMFLISVISGFAFMFLWANRGRPRAAA